MKLAKQYRKIQCILLGVIFSISSSAFGFRDPVLPCYAYNFPNKQYVATLKSGSFSVTARETLPNSKIFAPLAKTISGTFTDLESELLIKLQDSVGQKADFSKLIIKGPMKFDWEGKKNYAQTLLTLPEMQVDVSAKKSILIFTAKCDGTINIQKGATIYANVDLNEGLVKNIETRLGKISNNVSCDLNLLGIPVDFVLPVIGSLLNDIVSNKVNSFIDHKVESHLSKLWNPIHFLGLREALPDGQFVIKKIDVGSYLRQNLTGILQRSSVSIMLYPQNSYNKNHPYVAYGGKCNTPVVPILQIKFPYQKISLSLTSELRK